MKNEEKKAALNEYLEAQKEQRYWAKKLNELASKSKAGYVSPGAGGPMGGGGDGRPVENPVIELIYATEMEKKAGEEARQARDRVMRLIRQVKSADQRIVLMRRYIEGWGWEAIADAEGKSRTWATNLHGTAVKNITLPETDESS